MSQEELKPKYGAITALSLVVGTVVGVGIFLRAPRMSLSAGGDTFAIMTGWIVAALMIIPIAIVISEIASSVKRSGGAQVYAEETLGTRAGFGVGWIQSFFYLPANLTFMLYLTSDYTFQAVGIQANFVSVMILGAFYYLGLLFINVRSPKLGGQIQVAATFIKIIPLVLIGLIGSMYFGDKVVPETSGDLSLLPTFIENSQLSTIVKVAAVIPAAIFAFDGWIFVGVLAKEVKNPARNIPLAIVGGLSVISVLYLLFSYASFTIANPQDLALGAVNNTHLAAQLFGPVFGNIINIFVLVSALGVSNSNTLVMIRAPYALARSRNFPGSKFLSKVDPIRNIPINSAIFAAMFIPIYMFIPIVFGFHGNGNAYGMFIDAALLILFIIYALICVAVLVRRYTMPNAERPFKVPFIWLFVIVGVFGACFASYSLFIAYASAITGVVIYASLALAGFLLYSYTTKSDNAETNSTESSS